MSEPITTAQGSPVSPADLNRFTFYQANCVGEKNNRLYPNEVIVTDSIGMQRLVEKDYVCAKYQNNRRSSENFLFSDCICGDIDNDHTENSKFWVSPADVLSTFEDVPMIIHYSRHNDLPKGSSPARPRFHVIMRIDPETSTEAYKALKKRMQDVFPYFDTNALDSARFLFGTPGGKCEFHPGTVTLNDRLLTLEAANREFEQMAFNSVIREGQRNSTLHRDCVKFMKRFGADEDTHIRFLKDAERCDPPLEDDELNAIWNSALRYYKGTILKDPNYVAPEKYAAVATGWDEPIPFCSATVLPFPVDALPAPFADFASAVAASTQTPVDMAACCMLSIMATCLQGKYDIYGNNDWSEQLNLYVEVIAKPSERKSAVLNACLKPLNLYEAEYNKLHAPEIESSRMRRRILERKQKAIEDKVAKGDAEPAEMEHIAREISSFRERKPLQLYVDDITTEKLVSVLAENDGRTALISSEGGIFDMLAGTYSRNVNIDAMLKAYSGDTIRVDRIGRDSLSVTDPALTVLLMAQPSVVAEVLGNKVFRGRGLVGRFLFSNPVSLVGERHFHVAPIPESVSHFYHTSVADLLDESAMHEPITLSPEATDLLASFSDEIEHKIVREYWEMSDWAGKLVGNTLRIAGLICRASVVRGGDFMSDDTPLIVSADNMRNAIRIARYFTSHAVSVFSTMPENALISQALSILEAIVRKDLKEFSRRDAMRLCRSFRKAEDIQPVLDFLESYGYIAQKPELPFVRNGRPPLPVYLVHPNLPDCIVSAHPEEDSSTR